MSAIEQNRAALEDRLQALVAEYLRESDPATWPKLDTIPHQQARYWQKKHRAQLLAEINALQNALKHAPRQAARADEDSDTGRMIAEAKRRARELRERAGLLPPKVQQ